MSRTDFSALQKWNKIPRDIQRKILDNVFCSYCHVTTIVDYTMREADHGYVIEGKCKKCGKNVARFMEDN